MLQIPIQNLYYLICYAWDILDFKSLQPVAADHIESPIDLLAYMLDESCKELLKRGLSSDYVDFVDEVYGVKGKFLIGETLQKCHLRAGRTVCRTDEYSRDFLLNQIVRSTLHFFARDPRMQTHLSDNLLYMEKKWAPSSIRPLSTRDFRMIHIHRLNRHYGLVIRICELIWQNLVPTEEDGRYIFESFERNEQYMRKLFESFVRNFYHKELKGTFEVTAKSFLWSLDISSNAQVHRYLPRLYTDACLINTQDSVIVETKYVPEIFSSRITNHDKIRSAHLYQLMSYLENYRRNFKVTPRGILLYPAVTKDVCLKYNIWDMEVQVATIDLSRDWKQIHDDLLKIVAPEHRTYASKAV